MKEPHLLFIHDEELPLEIPDQFSQNIHVESLNFHRHSLPSRGPQGSLELLGFTAIVLLIVKPYFEGFLKEAGKDHYNILKREIQNLWRKLTKGNDNFQFVVMTSEGEVKTEYSLLFSICTQINNDVIVKFLLREDWSENEYESAIDAFMKLIKSYHSSDSQLSIDIDNERNYFKQILVTFDAETESLIVIHPKINES